MFETILEFRDDALADMKVEIVREVVRITEEGKRYIYVTAKGLADIADAVEQYLEIESAAEYIDDIVLED